MGIGGAVGIAPQGCAFVGVGPFLRIPWSHMGRIVVLLGERCELLDVDGAPLDLSDLRGHRGLITFERSRDW